VGSEARLSFLTRQNYKSGAKSGYTRGCRSVFPTDVLRGKGEKDLGGKNGTFFVGVEKWKDAVTGREQPPEGCRSSSKKVQERDRNITRQSGCAGQPWGGASLGFPFCFPGGRYMRTGEEWVIGTGRLREGKRRGPAKGGVLYAGSSPCR